MIAIRYKNSSDYNTTDSCRNSLAQETPAKSWLGRRAYELDRLNQAEQELSSVVNRYQDLSESFANELTRENLSDTVDKFGKHLWTRAVQDVQSGNLDDRPLYWTRLRMLQILRDKGFSTAAKAFDHCSRGLHSQDTRDSQIIVTGFDPYRLNTHIDQCNPSGLIALSLQGQRIHDFGINTAVFPVRYADFDEDHCIEHYMEDSLQSKSVVLFVTSSMGRQHFDIDRFPLGRRTASAPDNCGVVCSNEIIKPFKGIACPTIEEKSARHQEFVEASLPTDLFDSSQPYGNWKTVLNKEVETMEKGVFNASSLDDLQNQTGVQGSGGGFLSNEISYRSILCLKHLGMEIPVGHIHVPRIDGYHRENLKFVLDQFRSILFAVVDRIK